MASTRVVLPWSTCAMMAMLRMPELKSNSFLISFSLPLYYAGRSCCGFLSGKRGGSRVCGMDSIQAELRVLIDEVEIGGIRLHVPVEKSAVIIEGAGRDEVGGMNSLRVLPEFR